MLDWEHVFATRSKRMRASEIRELLKLLDRPDIISFAGGIPDPALFPKDVFAESYARVLTGEGAGTALQYSVSEGNLSLRKWLVGYMASLGISCQVENIIITSGSQQGLDYLGKLLLSPGDTALVNWPTYLGALQAFNAYEPHYDRLIPLGNRPAEDFVKAAQERGGAVKFAYASADFANPTGETLDRQTRERILDLAGELNIPVIEDAAYQSLRYDGEPVPPMLALDIARCGHIDAARTIYCGSFSKTLSPGLRVGWICAAAPVISRLVLMKQAADLNTSTINQMVLADVAERYFDTQVETIRKAYQARRDCMLDALSRHMPQGCSWSRPDGGMFVWVTLPEGLDGATLLARSLETVKVAFVPGKAFFADGSGANTLRLSFSCANETMIEEGISRLGKLIPEA
ncbi:PLP-dependent aminotransferase family protein [Pannonibacter indicus]|uniref:DNA-binding transcriptional regulator, MocR family, contains an aminotransferase domain n=1 Tax=Pannonibacter indicus TaxID=466044 RepID=A0A0K6HVD8_9HYPH|nr:PLP-dependent aminotransferase family protein [Pannonibacter indicus]CUA94738.1 DNA-binding transcriptional regulator, MocR family, contains an aminotransferase domain [Pannonibacter indicus]